MTGVQIIHNALRGSPLLIKDQSIDFDLLNYLQQHDAPLAIFEQLARGHENGVRPGPICGIKARAEACL
jgi:hypothetical protein